MAATQLEDSLPGREMPGDGHPTLSCVSCRGVQPRKRQTQNSLIGNGFHIPSVLAILCFIPQLLATKIPLPMLDYEEVGLKGRLVGTIWQPGRIETFPGLLNSTTVVNEVQSSLVGLDIAPQVWSETDRRLSFCRLERLQYFAAWCRMRGMEWTSLGPRPITSRDRTAIFAGLSGQRYPASSTRGLDHLLPPGLGPEEHMAASAGLPSPFIPRSWPEPDVTFLVQALVTWRQFMIPFAAELRKTLRTLVRAVAPWKQLWIGTAALHRKEWPRQNDQASLQSSVRCCGGQTVLNHVTSFRGTTLSGTSQPRAFFAQFNQNRLLLLMTGSENQPLPPLIESLEALRPGMLTRFFASPKRSSTKDSAETS